MNRNSKIDLIALTHPLVLLSIFILLINDHVLKVYIPSALTGKISDFAGLFFFPILLSAILHFVLKPFQFQSRNIALTSFGFTAIFFSFIKTVPFFNNFIENLFSIQIILDLSDLIALIMLPLAWKLREKVENESKAGVSKLSYVVLGIASLAALASSPAYNIENNSFQDTFEEFYYLVIFAWLFSCINTVANAINRNTLEYRKAITYSLMAIISYLFLVYLNTLNLLFGVGIIISFSCAILTIVFTIDQLNKNTNNRAKNNIALIVLIALMSYGSFILWAYGTIPVYETALWIAIGLHIFLLIWILYLPIKEFIQSKSSRSKRDLPE